MSNTLEFIVTAVDRASDVFDKVGGAADTNAGRFDKWKGVAAAGAAIVGAAVVKFGVDSVEAYNESVVQHAKLEDAFARFPALADTNIDAFDELNAAMAKKTTYDDDAYAAGEAQLAQYGLTGSQLQQLTPLVADFAAKQGIDLATASEQVGKAMLGQGKALKGVGIDFQDTGSVAGNFQQVLGGLTTQVGGYAEQVGATAAGKTEILKNQFGELQEKVGAQLVPVLSSLLTIGLQVLDWLNQNPAVMYAVIAVVGGLTVAVLALNAAFLANPITWIIVGIAALVAAIAYAWNNCETFRNVVTTAWNGIRTAWTWLWDNALQPGLQALGAAISWLWNNVAQPAWDGFQTALHAVGQAGIWLWNNALQPAFSFIVGGIAWLLRTWGDMLSGLSHVPGFGWAGDAARAMQGAADKADSLKDGIKRIDDQPDPHVTVQIGVAYSPGYIAAMRQLAINKAAILDARAAGGPVRKGRTYLVGENGPELWTADEDGSIIDAADTARMLAGSAGGVGAEAAAGSTQPLVVQLQLDGRTVQQSLLQLKRENGRMTLGLA